MGLDTVELVPRCEEVFEVNLPDHKLNHIRTVGDLYIRKQILGSIACRTAPLISRQYSGIRKMYGPPSSPSLLISCVSNPKKSPTLLESAKT